MSDKPKYPRSTAIAAVRDLLPRLSDACEKIIIAGSLRRLKESVGDIELLYIPKFTSVPDGLFDTRQVNLVDTQLELALSHGLIKKRPTATGAEPWGPKNKYAIHIATGIPVDFFSTTAESWSNYLVCRTGSAENNVRIASAAQSKGWKWHPYGSGFTDEHGNPVPVTSERDVFRLVGLPYLEPWKR